MSNEYLLITPAKNEADNIPDLIQSITNQSKRPVLWIIIDDGSTDGGDKIIEETSIKNPWIYIFRLQESERDTGFHYNHICRVGFSKAMKLAQEQDIEYDYIALLDADMKLETNYFNFLIEKMEHDPKIGIASGGTWSLKDGEYHQGKQIDTLPSGGARIWKRKCFIKTNGYEDAISSDSISNVRANIAGWKTKRFEEIKAYQSRPASSAEGMSKGYYKRGEANYFFRVHPVIILARMFLVASKGNINLNVAFVKGYLHALKTKKPRLTDPELRNHFRTKSIKTFLRGEL